MTKKTVIVTEVAEQDFERFADQMDLDLNTDTMDEEDRKEFEKQKSRLVDAIKSGALEIADNGEPTFTPQRSKNTDPITFHEPTGAALMAMDRKKKTEDVGKLYAAMGEITGKPANTFSKMKMADLKICMAITTLFLG